jgi:ubiquinone/menaquinone biosynthesis C-methylase UbiE
VENSSRAGANIARQRRFWTRRAAEWDHGAATNPGLARVVARVLEEARPAPNSRAVDLGCGSGQVTLPLAREVASVLAVDVSGRMIELLQEHCAVAGIDNVETRVVPIEGLELPPASVDLVVSNYALHHLRDADKRAVVGRAQRWLRPGGRLVIGDMMFGRGGEPRDREIILSKLRVLTRKGPAGWWRVLKNAYRFLVRVHERPVSMTTWVTMLEEAGFADVSAIPVVNEAGVVVGTRRA